MPKAVTIFDHKLKLHSAPFFFTHEGQADRQWSEMVNDPKMNVCIHPHEFEMFVIGEFNEKTGEYTPHEPRSLGFAASRQDKELVRELRLARSR